MTTIVWFRIDLRLVDNPALHAAAARGAVVPVFIHAPEEEQPWSPGGASLWWLHQSLTALDASLKQAGSRLVIRKGATLATLLALIEETGATGVYWNRRYEPAVIGLGGVKWYDWAPAGFVSDFRWNESTGRFYYPLWLLDREFWHQPIHSSELTGTYPINEVAPGEIGRVYEAWSSK